MTLLVVVELLLFSQVDEKRFLYISVSIYLFCFVWQMLMRIRRMAVLKQTVQAQESWGGR